MYRIVTNPQTSDMGSGLTYIELDEGIFSALGADASAASNMINDFNYITRYIILVFCCIY